MTSAETSAVSSLIEAMALEPGSRSTSCAAEPAPPRVAAALGLEAGASVARFAECGRRTAGRWSTRSTGAGPTCCPSEQMASLDGGSIYAALAERGLPVHHGVATIEPATAERWRRPTAGGAARRAAADALPARQHRRRHGRAGLAGASLGRRVRVHRLPARARATIGGRNSERPRAGCRGGCRLAGHLRPGADSRGRAGRRRLMCRTTLSYPAAWVGGAGSTRVAGRRRDGACRGASRRQRRPRSARCRSARSSTGWLRPTPTGSRWARR